MHTGLFAVVKTLVPLSVYILSMVMVFRAMTGKIEIPLMFLIAILPLRNVVDKLHAYPFGKDIIDIFIISLLLGIIVKAMTNKNENLFSRSPINPIIAVLILYTFMSLIQGAMYLNEYKLFSLSDPRVQTWKNFCILPILFIITFNGIKEKKWIWRIIAVMCVSMVFMDYYLLMQISWFSSLVSRNKIKGTFVFLGPNEVAAFYNQYTIILMSIYFCMKRSWVKIALGSLIVVNIFCVLFLFSRAAYVGIAVGMFFLFSLKNRKYLILLLLVLIFWQLVLPEKIKQRIGETTNEYGELDESSANRLIVWQYSIDMFSENPITGVGYGVFSQMGFGLTDTHNIYLKILAEQGLVGITIFLLLILVFFLQGAKLASGGEDDLEKGLGLGYAICIIVLMCNNVFGDRWTYMTLSSNLWVFTALVARLNYMGDQTRSAKRLQNQKTNKHKKIPPSYGRF